MIPRRKHNASSGSLPAPDDKHASNDYILSDKESRIDWRTALRRRLNRKTLHKRLPITAWLPQYNAEKAIGDLIAGITVGLTVIPQSLAYSNIAGLPPQHGLYGSFLGCFVYIVLGGCRAVPAGPTAIASLLTFQVAGGVLEKAILLTFLAGLVKLLMGVLGLGFLINFVSGPVSSGFTSAVALMIATSQVKDLFAISVSGTTFLQQWISIFRNLHAASLWDPVLGFICIALLLLMRKIGMIKLGAGSEEGPNTRQKVITKCLWLISTCRNAIVVVATGVLGFWFVAKYGQSPVRLMGAIPSGVPVPQPPPFSYVRADNTTADFLDMVAELGSGLLVIPLIVVLEDIAICKAFSDGRTIDATQEMIALGVASIANSFMQAYPGGGSLARSVVANGSGVKTTLNGFYTGLMVILALQFFTQYFEYIPKSALAAVIISAIVFMVEYNVIKPMWRAKIGPGPRRRHVRALPHTAHRDGHPHRRHRQHHLHSVPRGAPQALRGDAQDGAWRRVPDDNAGPLPDVPVGGLRAQAGDQVRGQRLGAGSDRVHAHLQRGLYGRQEHRAVDGRFPRAPPASLLLQREALRVLHLRGRGQARALRGVLRGRRARPAAGGRRAAGAGQAAAAAAGARARVSAAPAPAPALRSLCDTPYLTATRYFSRSISEKRC